MRRMTVAVLVNGIYNVEGSDVAYAERPLEELNRMAELVKSAVGFEEGRGDSVSVDSMRFMDYSMDLGDPIDITLADRLTESVVPIIRGLLALLIIALVMVLAVRPILRRLDEPDALELEKGGVLPSPSGDAATSTQELEQSAENRGYPMLPPVKPNDGATKATLPSTISQSSEDGTGDQLEDYVTKQGIRGSLYRKNIDKIQHLADDNPEEVLRVLRSWLSTEAEA